MNSVKSLQNDEKSTVGCKGMIFKACSQLQNTVTLSEEQ